VPIEVPTVPVWIAPVTTPDTLNQQSLAGEFSVPMAGEGLPIPIVYGDEQVDGVPFDLIYDETTDTYTWGIYWCWGEIEANDGILINGAAPVAGVTVTHYRGTTAQTADPTLTAALGSAYPDNLVVTNELGTLGIAYSVVQYTGEHYKNIPRFVAEIRGRKVYDPRTTLIAYSLNPALHARDIITEPFFGPAEQINDASVIEVANACDQIITTEARRQLSITLRRKQSWNAWIDTFAQYAGCWIFKRGAEWVFIPDRPKAVDFTLTADDFISFEPAGSPEQPTHVRVWFTDKTSDVWRSRHVDDVLPGVSTSVLPRKTTEVRLPGVDRITQALREAKEYLAKLNSSIAQAEIVLPDQYIGLEKGDVLSVTHPVGFTNQLMRVISVPRQQRAGRISARISVYDPADYSDSESVPAVYTNPAPVIGPPPSAKLGSDVQDSSGEVVDDIDALNVFAPNDNMLLDPNWSDVQSRYWTLGNWIRQDAGAYAYVRVPANGSNQPFVANHFIPAGGRQTIHCEALVYRAGGGNDVLRFVVEAYDENFNLLITNYSDYLTPPVLSWEEISSTVYLTALHTHWVKVGLEVTSNAASGNYDCLWLKANKLSLNGAVISPRQLTIPSNVGYEDFISYIGTNFGIVSDATRGGSQFHFNNGLRVQGDLYVGRIIDYDNNQSVIDLLGTSYFNRIDATQVFDRNNTAYYSDPASTSIFNDLRATTFYCRENTAYFLNLDGTSLGYSMQAALDMRAPVFYDRNNTAYYFHGDSLVQMYRLNVHRPTATMATLAPGIEIIASGSGGAAQAAQMAFHRPAAYGVTFGLDTDNQLKLGYWSAVDAKFIWNFGGHFTAVGSVYAPIFYDNNNTAYYADPDGFYSNGRGYRAYREDGSTNPVLGPDTFGFWTYGYYGGGIGMSDGTGDFGMWLTGGASRVLRMGFGNNTGALTEMAYMHPNTFNVTGDIRSDIFYDRADTQNWFNAGDIQIRGASPTLRLKDTDHRSAFVHVNSNIFYILGSLSNDAGSWNQVNGQWPLEINITTNYAHHGGAGDFVGNLTWNVSDGRLKTNKKRLTGVREGLKKCFGYSYDWKRDETIWFGAKSKFDDFEDQVGCITQEWESAFPQVVAPAPFDTRRDLVTQEPISRSGHDFKTLRYEMLTPYLLEGWHLHEDDLDELKTKVADLEKTIETLLAANGAANLSPAELQHGNYH
jgi:hypothetical protein